MCGKFGTDAELAKKVRLQLNVELEQQGRDEILPSESITAIVEEDQSLSTIKGNWGIKPSWSKQLLINARAESVDTKPTFREQYRFNRCLIPMSHWFDSKKDPSTGKIIGRYRFAPKDKSPLYMAAIFYPLDGGKIVSLTTAPNAQVSDFKDRMPLIFQQNHESWLINGTTTGDINLDLKIQAV